MDREYAALFHEYSIWQETMNWVLREPTLDHQQTDIQMGKNNESIYTLQALVSMGGQTVNAKHTRSGYKAYMRQSNSE